MPLDHEMIFRRAWEDPAATRYELPAVDVNQALADRYDLGRPLAFTRTLLWDLEARKPAAPTCSSRTSWRPAAQSRGVRATSLSAARCSVSGSSPTPMGWCSSRLGSTTRTRS